MTEEIRREFADKIRQQGLDWSFKWVNGEKIFTNETIHNEWMKLLRSSL